MKQCVCGYATPHSSNFAKHRRICKLVKQQEHDREMDRLRAMVDDNQAVLDSTRSEKDRLLVEKDRLIAEKDERIRYLEQLVMNLTQGAGAHMTELHREVKEVRKRKDRCAGLAVARCHLTEPQRRAIAIRQGWKCNMCRCDLIEYDVDHIEPLCRGGQDEDANRQAVCVACHRQKTDRERVARATGEAPAEPAAGPVVVG